MMQNILKTCPTLFKIGGIGQVLQWDIDVHEVADGTGALIIIDHGQRFGKLQQDRELVTEGKNLGRANETTAEQQALSQAESRWLKQKDNGYRETIEAAPREFSGGKLFFFKGPDGEHIEFCQGIAIDPV